MVLGLTVEAMRGQKPPVYCQRTLDQHIANYGRKKATDKDDKSRPEGNYLLCDIDMIRPKTANIPRRCSYNDMFRNICLWLISSNKNNKNMSESVVQNKILTVTLPSRCELCRHLLMALQYSKSNRS